MKNQSCFQEFLQYSSLSVLGMLGVSCYILADTLFVSKGLGTEGLAALNIAIPVYNFIHGTGLMCGMGGATKFSICKSQRDGKKTDKIFSNTIYSAMMFALVFVMVGLFLSENLTVLLGADADIFEMTDTYLKWLLIFAPAYIMSDVMLCFIRNDGSPKLSMAAMIMASLSNILLDYIFIFSMHMGIFGAVLATGLSPVISLIILASHRLRKKNTFHFIISKPDFRIVGTNLSLGLPSLIDQISAGVVMITFNFLILNLQGNTGVAAYGIIANISLVIIAVYTGIAQGIQPLISKYYGVNNIRNVRRMLSWAMMTMLVFSCGIYLFIFNMAKPITVIFNSENNFRLQEIAVRGLKLYFLSALFVGFNTIIAIYFTSIERPIQAHMVSLLRGLIIIIPMTCLLSALWGITGIWISYPITELLVAIIAIIIYRWNKKDCQTTKIK